MSLFDRFVSVLKSGVGGGRPSDLEGPLKLRPGDQVTHYNEVFVVAGIRVLESEAANVYLYCLQDEVGSKAVLSAVDGPSPEFTLQRFIDHQVRWESSVVDDFDDETYHFSGEGRCKLHSVGDTGVRGCRSVDFRLFGDEAGDQMLVLEDYAGKRETRLAEPLFDGEFEITRGERRSQPSHSQDGVIGGIETISESPSGTVDMDFEALKGSPMAAAMAMSHEKIDEPAEVLSESQDQWSDAYDDDSWSDDEFDDDRPAHRPSAFAAKQRKARVIQASMPSPEDESEEVPASVFDTARGEDENWLGF